MNTPKLVALIVMLSAIFACNINADAQQSGDTLQLIYPIPQDDGNPLNYNNNSSGFYLSDPDNITREVVYALY